MIKVDFVFVHSVYAAPISYKRCLINIKYDQAKWVGTRKYFF